MASMMAEGPKEDVLFMELPAPPGVHKLEAVKDGTDVETGPAPAPASAARVPEEGWRIEDSFRKKQRLKCKEICLNWNMLKVEEVPKETKLEHVDKPSPSQVKMEAIANGSSSQTFLIGEQSAWVIG
ncbi:hypothetical protein SDJN02_14538, partial [Cucurbita argyrosperma subsp. argyrosperma]